MIISISRADVIKAIREEPVLASGNWFHYEIDGKVDGRGPGTTPSFFRGDLRKTTQIADVKVCGVCGVGAVMRRVLSADQAVQSLFNAVNAATADLPTTPMYWADYESEALRLVEDGAYMAALSVFFEGATNAHGLLKYGDKDQPTQEAMAGVRQDTIDFIHENFPSMIDIDINGALPAADVVELGEAP